MNRVQDHRETNDDDRPAPGQADAVVSGTLGWIFILIGSAAVAAAAMIPAYFDTLDIQQARAEKAAQAQMLADERERYEQFHQALLDNDPVLIERLAISELRLKPVGTEVAQRAPRDPVAMVSETGNDAIAAALAAQPVMRSIENELSRPDLKQQAATEIELERPRRTRLVAAATGEHRPWVMGFGALLLLMGLWPRRAAG